MLAFAILLLGYLGYIEPRVNEATALATRAAELDRDDPWAYVALGFVAFIERRTDESVAHFQRALDLNPNFAAAHGYLGWNAVIRRAIGELPRALANGGPHEPARSPAGTVLWRDGRGALSGRPV